jgi:hypothetical protein
MQRSLGADDPTGVGGDMPRRFAKAVCIGGAGALLCVPLCGCLVAGYSSGGGWWVWPGSLAITLVLMLVWLVSRR